MNSFQQAQLEFTRHLRSPDQCPVPDAIDARRMGIYRDLIYNNIEGFISGAFPVLRSLLADVHWHEMVRDFIARHRCRTPYFLEISQEFLHYLMDERGKVEGDPPFILELAHYEWIELALDIAQADIPAPGVWPNDVLLSKPQVSPLVACLTYQYPVHNIGPGFQPSYLEPSHLVVYRNRDDQVKFMAANALTHRLLHLLQQPDVGNLEQVLGQIAQELQHPNPAQLLDDGVKLVEALAHLSIISHVEH